MALTREQVDQQRKQAEEHQALLAREVDHRARNALALVQSIVRLTRASRPTTTATATATAAEVPTAPFHAV